MVFIQPYEYYSYVIMAYGNISFQKERTNNIVFKIKLFKGRKMSKDLMIGKNSKLASLFDEKISIFIGAYGSGKSEVAVNFAMYLADRNKVIAKNNVKENAKNIAIKNAKNIAIKNAKDSDKDSGKENDNDNFMDNDRGNESSLQYNEIVLADLDIINPYFRSVDAKIVLEKHGVHVISPQFANTNIEIPAIPGEIYSVFDQPQIRGVLDIGGEDLGARVVANLQNRIMSVPFAVYMVVNLNRPFTNSKEKIITMMRELEETTGLKTKGFINNTNLLSFSCVDDLLNANEVLRQVEIETGVPVAFASGMHDNYPAEWGNETPDNVPFLRLSRTISYEEPLLFND